MLLGGDGEYEFGVPTSEVFKTDRPWLTTIDLPALAARRSALLGRSADARP